MSINKVILIGNLGRDPEIKYANNGNAIASLALATTKKWTDKQTGQKHEKQNGIVYLSLIKILLK